MYLVLLFLLPLIIGICGLFLSKGKITIKEFLVMEGAVFVILTIGYLIARWSSTLDQELWNGKLVKKSQDWTSCSHSYSCNCRQESCGKDCTTTVCDTCYEHSNDWNWNLYNDSGEVITIDRIDRQGVREPPRWARAYIGEPTATEHYFTNYIKAHPDSILRRRAAIEPFKKLIPQYPIQIYDYHYCNRFLPVGVKEPHERDWNRMIQEINGNLGRLKQVNIVVIAVKTSDPSYEYALEEAWVGGKKNDLIVLLGVPEYPKISWASVVSWSKSEDLKVQLRDAILDLGTMEKRTEIGTVIHDMVKDKFVRRRMREFKYLAAGIQPGSTGTIILFIIGVASQGFLLKYFWDNDPFDSGYTRYRSDRYAIPKFTSLNLGDLGERFGRIGRRY